MASTSGGPRHGTNSNAASSNPGFLFHLVSFLTYLYIFCWHFSKQASTLPQAWEFGWYFKFVTFCGFTFQMVALTSAFISHLWPEGRMLKRIANDMSCAAFEIANTTTLVYWTVIFWTADPGKVGWKKAAHKSLHQGLVDGFPLWVSLVVNIGISAVAWADLLIAERTFRKSSFYITSLFVVIYGCWVHACEARNEDFPHPFTRPLRQPEGSMIVTLLAFTFVLLLHKIGSKLANRGTSPLARKIKLV